LEPIKSFEAPATINSASLHPEKEFLVAGGEDFKLYKYDYNSGEELGEFFAYSSCKMLWLYSSDVEFQERTPNISFLAC
jgi:hypothetical protein